MTRLPSTPFGASALEQILLGWHERAILREVVDAVRRLDTERAADFRLIADVLGAASGFPGAAREWLYHALRGRAGARGRVRGRTSPPPIAR